MLRSGERVISWLKLDEVRLPPPGRTLRDGLRGEEAFDGGVGAEAAAAAAEALSSGDNKAWMFILPLPSQDQRRDDESQREKLEKCCAAVWSNPGSGELRLCWLPTRVVRKRKRALREPGPLGLRQRIGQSTVYR